MYRDCKKCGSHHHLHHECGCVKPSTRCEPKPCGCPIKLDTDCVIYTGEKNGTLHIEKGDNLTYILKMLTALFAEEDVQARVDSMFTRTTTQNEVIQRAEYTGLDICPLPKVPQTILAVYLNGLLLPSVQYVLEGHEVFIETASFDNPVGENDTVIIFYT